MKTIRMPGANAPMVSFLQNSDDGIPEGTEILGKYVVERTLGKGGMGIVIAARHQGLGELHAIKFLLPTVLVHPQAITRFEREARAAARLRSEHVARVMDVGRTPTGEPYMVMEYLEGQDLKSILQHGPLALEDAIDYLLQACDAVAEAHLAGIVHRDLKPANLFLTIRSNGSPCIKVLDFGIAKISDPNEAEITREGMVGSLKYMSPEQILKSKSADWRADIWQLGMITFEFLTAQTPFGTGSHVDMLANIMEEEPILPSVLRPDLPPSIETIILRCLRKNREERFQSVRELADALRDAAGLPPPNAPRIRALSISNPVIVAPTLVEEKTERAFGVTDNPGPSMTTRRRLHRPLLAAGAVMAMGSVLAFAGLRRNGNAPSSTAPVAANAAIVAPELIKAPMPAVPIAAVTAEHLEPVPQEIVALENTFAEESPIRDEPKATRTVAANKLAPVGSAGASAAASASIADKPPQSPAEAPAAPIEALAIPGESTGSPPKAETKSETAKPEMNTGFEFD